MPWALEFQGENPDLWKRPTETLTREGTALRSAPDLMTGSLPKPELTTNTMLRMVRLSDQELMRRVKAGQVDAFEEVVERYKAGIYALCFSMLRSREDAEEAAQDTFVKLFRNRQQFDEERALEPWLMRIAGNASRDLLRRRRSQRSVPMGGDGEDGEDFFLQSLEDKKGSAERHRAATREAVRQVIQEMSERFRQPLVLRYLNGLTNRQIAETLGISISNVKLRLARAKDVLQSRLTEIRDA